VDKGFFSNLKGLQVEGDITADFSDIRKLQILEDKISRLGQILRLNIRLGRKLDDVVVRIEETRSLGQDTNDDGLHLDLIRFVSEHETSLDRMESLLLRSKGIGQLVGYTATIVVLSLTETLLGSKDSGYSSDRSKQADKL
jgi:hypothetical protein